MYYACVHIVFCCYDILCGSILCSILVAYVIKHVFAFFFFLFFFLSFCPPKWYTYNAIVLVVTWLVSRMPQPCRTCLMSFQANPHTQAACVFSCSLPPALLAKERGLLRATAETWPWNGYRNKSRNRKSSVAKKVFFPPFLSWSTQSHDL